MIKTTYTCDRCKSAQDTPKQFWCVEARACTAQSANSGQWYVRNNHRMDVCRSCAEDLGFVPVLHGRVGPPEPSLEDIIHDMIQDAGGSHDG